MRPLTVRLLILWAALAFAAPADAANVLLVTDQTTLNSEETARKTQFEGWGHTVTTVHDGATQATFDTAVAAANVVYVPYSVQGSDIAYKVRTVTIGVVHEGIGMWDDEMGWTTTNGTSTSSGTLNIGVTDNTHAVTTGLSTGNLAVWTSTTNSNISTIPGTIATGAQSLATRSGNTTICLAVLDTGATLANTYSGNSTASGRRVRLPFGGNSFSWSNITSNGLTIVRQAIAWGAVGSTSNQLVLHWKLNETSGTTAVDASALGNTGTYSGGPTLGQTAPRLTGALFPSQGIYASAAASSSLNSLGASNADFTVALWVKPGAPDGNWRSLVHKGAANFERNPGLWLNPGSNRVHYRVSTTANNNEGADSISDLPVDAWSHLVFVKAGSYIRLYVNGALDSSLLLSAAMAGNSGPFYLGHSPWNSSAKAAFDDVRVYNYALSNAQVAEVHGLIAHWKLNETTGTTADDSTLSNHDATLTGTTAWTTGKDANAHDFDYATGEDYFTAPSTTALDNVQEDDYTIMAYVKPNSLPPGSGSANTANYAILSKQGWHLGLKYDNAGHFFTEHWIGTTPTWYGAGTWGTAYPPGRFYHVAAVVSRTNGTIKLFVDGVLINTGTFTAGSAAYEFGTSRWRIGVSGPGATEWGSAADAVIDDARIYNRALSDEEIAEYANPGLVAHWKFDETSGTAITDSSGNGNDAAFETGTPTWVAGVRGNAIQFNGSNDAQTIADFDPPAVGSIAFWFRSAEAPTGTERLLGLSGEWEVRTETSQALNFDLSGPGGGNFQTASGVAAPGVWRHVVAVYNTTTDTHKIYLDGTLVSSGAFSCADESPNELSFGTRTGSSQRFNGALDDLRIYNYELTGAEVAELYGLVGHWKFDEGAGTTVADSSGAAAHAAFGTGTPAWVSGVRGYALDFDGTTDTQTLSAFSPPAEGSVAFWIRSQSPPTANRRILGLGGDWEARMYPDGMIYFDFCGDSPAGALTVLPIPHDGRWQHVVHVFDSDDDSFTTYLNGQLASTGVATVDRVPQAAAKLSFGTRTGSTERFAGALDDVRVYNRSLQPREIADLYGLVGHWKLGETSGSVAADSSGYDRDGVYAGVQLGHPGPTSDLPLAARIVPGSVVDLTSQTKFNLRESLGVAFWMKLNAISESWHPLGWEESPSYDAYRVYMSDDRSWGLQLNPGTSVSGAVGTASLLSGMAQTGAWAHYAASYSGNEIVLYRNGVKVAATPVTGVTVGETITTMFLGNQPQGGVEAEMADFRLYNRAFFPGEARQLYYGDWTPGLRIVKWVEAPNP